MSTAVQLDQQPRLAPPRALKVEVAANGDIGAIAQKHFDRGVASLTLKLTNPQGSYYISNMLTVPEHCHLCVEARDYQHKYIGETKTVGKAEDRMRCPTTIHLLSHEFLHRPGSPYYGMSVYVSILVLEHASLRLRGVTLVEDLECDISTGKKGIYHEGSIHLRGPFASISLWDCRVEFTQKSFINSHAYGMTFSSLMHVRWVSRREGETSKQYPVTALPGQSMNGNEAVVSRTGMVVENKNVLWADKENGGADCRLGNTVRYLV